MPENDDSETSNTLDNEKDQPKNSLTTDPDSEASGKDGPHQGRHDIGGYVPST